MGLFSDLKEKITKHIQVRIDLLKLDMIEGSSGILSYFMFAFICLFIFFAIILFFGLGLSEVFSDAGMSRGASFLLTMGIYCLLLFIVVLLRKSISRFFSGVFIRIMTEGDVKDDADDKNESKN